MESSFERCCRLCAKEQEVTIMIFSDEAEAMLLQNKLNKYLLIEVDEDDKLPKNICIECCTKLQTVCEFIDTARKAQELLLARSLMLDHVATDKYTSQICTVNADIKTETDDDARVTEMEVSVDPMMVLQNCEEPLSPNPNDIGCCDANGDEIIYLHGVDGENVTIKLIRKGDQPSDGVDDKKEVNWKPFPCITCKRSFLTELALKNHSWTHFGDDKNLKLYQCSTCHNSFINKCELINHLKVHRTSGMCTICGRAFRNQRNLDVHMAVHLSSGKSYTCKVCGRSYNTRSNLKTHSITHSTERPFQCHLCKKNFKRNQDLKFHINQHTGAKPYKCPFCEKCFASSGNCYSHRSRMHPGRRIEGKIIRRPAAPRDNQTRVAATKTPIASVKGIFKFQCQLCDHSFMKRDNFTYHMYQHTGEKPFQCLFCPEEFVTRRGLQLHHDKHHPSKDRPLVLFSKNALLK